MSGAGAAEGSAAGAGAPWPGDLNGIPSSGPRVATGACGGSGGAVCARGASRPCAHPAMHAVSPAMAATRHHTMGGLLRRK
ncbi:hypothetical protein GCM10028795_22780 [Lysobacter olei]